MVCDWDPGFPTLCAATCRGKLQNRRCKLNQEINKELRLRAGAENLYKATTNKKLKDTVALELSFVNSNLQLLKDRLSELNSSMEIYQNEGLIQRHAVYSIKIVPPFPAISLPHFFALTRQGKALVVPQGVINQSNTKKTTRLLPRSNNNNSKKKNGHKKNQQPAVQIDALSTIPRPINPQGSDPRAATCRGKLQNRRCKLNQEINKELRLRAGAENLYKATTNKKLKDTVALELSFVNSNLQLLKSTLGADSSMESTERGISTRFDLQLVGDI
ncbi:rhophilin [Culex quinquefasciatus]|uniref:Rhophilin n=1 Tax=Culex quinquefasciatus TaxID=7176 RepID=B0WV20_CULQU|nr:rhophilin [Culex quinquefasciatus]|eukprot:XP_001871004.1 rhophilin [Culex quinquefasciatus]